MRDFSTSGLPFLRMVKRAPRIGSVCCAIGTLLVPLGAQERSADLSELLKDSVVKAALDAARLTEQQTIEDQIRFCEVPAPPFQERARGAMLRQAFEQQGLRPVRVDKAGNVIGERSGAFPRPRLVISAHLDTVFPEGTDVKVTRNGALLRGPGIGDDCRGLAVLVAIGRAMALAGVHTRGPVTFVATVGEEGLGDLRGVKQLFMETLAGEIDQFVSIDGTGLGVTNVAVGSLRYRMTFKGPGGHSYAAFGLANPISALGRAVAKIAELQVPAHPRTTFNVGRVGGGTSVNSIPSEAWMEIDLRSADPASLESIDGKVMRAVDEAVSEENARSRVPGIVTVVKERVGDRPAGSTAPGSSIVRTVEAVHRALGLPISLGESSTDSNIPISLGIPAITIGTGGKGTGAHAPTEAFDTTDAWLGTQRAVFLTLALSQK
ncbi:MAG: peptidase M20 [Blastocatellia bacterium]|nr:MAG: peptidase M20 [Blastocatellia bacterium]